MIEEAAEEEDATANNHAEEDNEDEHEDDSSTWTIHSAQAISDMQQKEQAQEKSFRHKASISGGDEASSSNNNNNNNTTTTNLNLNHSVAEFWENEFQRRELQAQNDDDGGGDLESSSSSEEGVCGADQEQCDKGDDHGPSHPPKAVDHKDHAIKEQYRPNAVPQFSMSSTINSLPSADEPPASNTTHTNTITSASSEEHSPTATMTTTMDRTSLPGAYAESPDLLDTRRSSVVKQVLATLGNEQDDLEMGTASSNFSHVMTETPTLASTTTTTTSTISRISTSEQSAECKDNNNNNFQEGEEVPSGDYEEHGIPSAKTVSDAEAIIYAQDVERDFFKRNQMLILVVGVLSIVLTCTLVVVLAKDDPHEYTGDPRCKNLDEETNVAVHCLCSNTTRNYLDRFEGEDEHYQSYTAILSILRNESIIKEDLQVVPESCLPENLSILFLSYNHDKIQMQDRSTLPRALLLRSYAVNMIYLRMGGLYWDRADNWLTWDAAGACSFHGIGCFFLSVTTELVLPSNNVVGTIASEIGLLSQLRTIDLSGNPGVVGTIPTELASIASLNRLDLSETDLTGQIPANLSMLESLDELILNDAKLSGTIPPELAGANLHVLTLAGNKLTGTIPTEIGNSPRLNSLLLGRNYLSGSLPTEMENLQTLEMFHIGKNQLSGTVPEFAGRLNKLVFANFLDSGITGAIPESYCRNRDQPTIHPVIVARCTGAGAIVANCSCCKNTTAISILCTESYPEAVVNNFLENQRVCECTSGF